MFSANRISFCFFLIFFLVEVLLHYSPLCNYFHLGTKLHLNFINMHLKICSSWLRCLTRPNLSPVLDIFLETSANSIYCQLLAMNYLQPFSLFSILTELLKSQESLIPCISSTHRLTGSFPMARVTICPSLAATIRNFRRRFWPASKNYNGHPGNSLAISWNGTEHLPGRWAGTAACLAHHPAPTNLWEVGERAVFQISLISLWSVYLWPQFSQVFKKHTLQKGTRVFHLN